MLNYPTRLLRNDIENDSHQHYIEDGQYFVIFEDGEMGINNWHHSVGWLKSKEVAYWYKPDIDYFNLIQSERKKSRDELFEKGIITSS